MKQYIKSTITHVLSALMFSAVVLVALPTSATAAAPEIVKKAAKKWEVEIKVPCDSDPVMYVLNGKRVKIAPCKTATLPSDAKKIMLPAGVIFTVTVGGKSKSASSNVYTLNQPALLATLSPEAINSQSGAFILGKQTGNIKLPSGAITNLMDAVYSLRATTVNPFNVLRGGDVTDGN